MTRVDTETPPHGPTLALSARNDQESERERSAPDTPSAAAAPRGIIPTPAQIAARNKRNVAIALSLLAFVALTFVVTIVRLSANVSGQAL